MKKIWKIIIVIAMLLVFTIGYAQQMVYVTGPEAVSWDAVVGATGYELFAKKDGVETSVGITTLTTFDVDVTLLGEGIYVIGVRALKEIQGVVIPPSDINWSDTNGEWTPVPFVLVYYLPVQMPKNFRVGH